MRGEGGLVPMSHVTFKKYPTSCHFLLFLCHKAPCHMFIHFHVSRDCKGWGGGGGVQA